MADARVYRMLGLPGELGDYDVVQFAHNSKNVAVGDGAGERLSARVRYRGGGRALPVG